MYSAAVVDITDRLAYLIRVTKDDHTKYVHIDSDGRFTLVDSQGEDTVIFDRGIAAALSARYAELDWIPNASRNVVSFRKVLVEAEET